MNGKLKHCSPFSSSYIFYFSPNVCCLRYLIFINQNVQLLPLKLKLVNCMNCLILKKSEYVYKFSIYAEFSSLFINIV